MLGGPAILEAVEDMQIRSQNMLESPYVKPFEEHVRTISTRLDKLFSLMEIMLPLQTVYVYLEPIFAAADIHARLPQEASLFAMVNQTWKAVMEVIKSKRTMVELVQAATVIEQELIGCRKEVRRRAREGAWNWSYAHAVAQFRLLSIVLLYLALLCIALLFPGLPCAALPSPAPLLPSLLCSALLARLCSACCTLLYSAVLCCAVLCPALLCSTFLYFTQPCSPLLCYPPHPTHLIASPLCPQLAALQLGVQRYLEMKRIEFPRFFFLSNEELLNLLSHAKDMEKMQIYFPRLFQSIESVVVKGSEAKAERADENDVPRIVSLASTFGESLYLLEEVPIFHRDRGDYHIPGVWLQALERNVRDSVLRGIDGQLDSYYRDVIAVEQEEIEIETAER